MTFTDKYPYTDFHELNLDWFLEKFKEVTDKVTDLDTTVQQFTDFVTNYFDNLDVQEEINRKLNVMAADGTLAALIQPLFNDYESRIDGIIEDQNEQITILEGRVNNLATIDPGSITTTADAELVDIRVKIDGTTAASAGDAVREQISDLNTEVVKINGDLYDRTNNFINPDTVLLGKKYVPGAGTPIQNDASWNLTELIDVSDWDGSEPLWFKSYGFTDYATGYRAIVYCFDGNEDYIATAASSTGTAAAFSAPPYRCKVFTLTSGTVYIRVQYYSSIDGYNNSAFYADTWTDTYQPYYGVPYMTTAGVQNIIDNNFSIPTVTYTTVKTGMSTLQDVNAIECLACGFNSALLNKEAFENRTKLYNYFSHDATLVCDGNGMGYVAYVTNQNSTGDSPTSTDAFVSLATIDLTTLSTSSTVTNYDVCKYGDTVNGLTVISGAGAPNAVFSGNAVVIFFSAKLSDNNWYLLRRVFDTSTQLFNAVEVCTLTANGTQADFTTNKISADIKSINTNYFISMNGQIAYDGTDYYAGVCVANYFNSGFIVTTNNLLDFTFWLLPNIDGSDSNFECISYYLDGFLYYAVRQSVIKKMIICKIDVSTQTITEVNSFTDSGARACFFEDNSKLYLMHSIDERYSTEIININTLNFNRNNVAVQSNVQMVYPSVVIYDNKIYLAATGNNSTAVYCRKISIPNYNADDITGVLLTMINNYLN